MRKYGVTKVVFNAVNLEPMTGVQNYQIKLIEVTAHLDRPNQLEVHIENKHKQLLMCYINDVVMIKIIGFDKHCY